MYVEGLSEWVVRNPREVYGTASVFPCESHTTTNFIGLIKRGAQIRATSYTRMNAVSSRSHAIFILIVEQNEVIVDPGADPSLTSCAVSGVCALAAVRRALPLFAEEDEHSKANTSVRETFKVPVLSNLFSVETTRAGCGLDWGLGVGGQIEFGGSCRLGAGSLCSTIHSYAHISHDSTADTARHFTCPHCSTVPHMPSYKKLNRQVKQVTQLFL